MAETACHICGLPLERDERPLAEMIEALRRHTRLLTEYRRLAFDEDRRDYRGEVAGKLRLLLLPPPDEPGEEPLGHIARWNTPLLRRVRERLGLAPRLDVDVFGGVRLDDFLRAGLAVERDGERLAVLKNAELINVWATQHGAAHEDWAFKGAFALLHPRGGDAETNLLDVAVTRISLIADATIEACEALLATIDENAHGDTNGRTQ